jgi:cell division protease FtsH
MSEGDRILATRSELSDRIAVLLGGRAGEELALGQPSTGSNDDLARATDLARRMVTECGMSEELGPLAFVPAANAEDASGGWSQTTAATIDAETQRIVRDAWTTATGVLSANRDVLAALANELVSVETIEGPPLAALLGAVVPPVDAGLWGELAALAS